MYASSLKERTDLFDVGVKVELCVGAVELGFGKYIQKGYVGPANREQGSASRQSTPTNFPSNPGQFAANERF